MACRSRSSVLLPQGGSEGGQCNRPAPFSTQVSKENTTTWIWQSFSGTIWSLEVGLGGGARPLPTELDRVLQKHPHEEQAAKVDWPTGSKTGQGQGFSREYYDRDRTKIRGACFNWKCDFPVGALSRVETSPLRDDSLRTISVRMVTCCCFVVARHRVMWHQLWRVVLIMGWCDPWFGTGKFVRVPIGMSQSCWEWYGRSRCTLPALKNFTALADSLIHYLDDYWWRNTLVGVVWRWWSLFLADWNGTRIMFSRSKLRPDIILTSDASGSWGCDIVVSIYMAPHYGRGALADRDGCRGGGDFKLVFGGLFGGPL